MLIIANRAQRDQFKACVLAVQYGMGEDALRAMLPQLRNLRVLLTDLKEG